MDCLAGRRAVYIDKLPLGCLFMTNMPLFLFSGHFFGLVNTSLFDVFKCCLYHAQTLHFLSWAELRPDCGERALGYDVNS